MKRVLEIHIDPFRQGGTQAFIAGVINHMTQDGLTIDLFTPYYVDEMYSDFVNSKFGKVYTNLIPFEEKKSRFEYCKFLDEVLKKEKYDVVHIHSVSILIMTVCSFIAKKNRVEKIIVHSHNSGEEKNFYYYLSKILSYPFLMICPTDYLSCSVAAGERKFPACVAKNKQVVVKNGIEVDLFKVDDVKRNEYRQKLGFLNDDLVIGHVGRFFPQKNHQFIIDLFVRLHNENDKYKLLLVGDGDLLDTVRKRVKEAGVSDSVVFTGNVNNVQDYMQAMDLFILPSKFEGLPFVGVEAQSCGLPMIASTGVPAETKLTGNVEFLPLGDISEWVEAVGKMIKLPKTDNTARIRSAGYDINDTAEKVREMYLK